MVLKLQKILLVYWESDVCLFVCFITISRVFLRKGLIRRTTMNRLFLLVLCVYMYVLTSRTTHGRKPTEAFTISVASSEFSDGKHGKHSLQASHEKSSKTVPLETVV